MRIESMSQVFVDDICLIDSSFRNRGLCHSGSSFYRSIVDYRLKSHRRCFDSAALQLWRVCKKQKDPSQQSSSPINSTFKLSSGSRQYKLSLHRSFIPQKTDLHGGLTLLPLLDTRCYSDTQLETDGSLSTVTLNRIPLLTTTWNICRYSRLAYINESKQTYFAWLEIRIWTWTTIERHAGQPLQLW